MYLLLRYAGIITLNIAPFLWTQYTNGSWIILMELPGVRGNRDF